MTRSFVLFTFVLAVFGTGGMAAGIYTADRMVGWMASPLTRHGLHAYVTQPDDAFLIQTRWAAAVGGAAASVPLAALLSTRSGGTRSFFVRTLLFLLPVAAVGLAVALLCRWQLEQRIGALVPASLPFEPVIAMDAIPLTRIPLIAGLAVLLAGAVCRAAGGARHGRQDYSAPS